MKLKSPRTLESWLFSVGAGLLLFMALLWGIDAILGPREQARVASSGNPGTTAGWLALEVAVSILELAGLSCLVLSALVSVFRTFLPSKSK